MLTNTFEQLVGERTRLALTTEIPDMAAYAEAWNKLAAEFEAVGARVNAAICRANWRHYASLVPGAYAQVPSGELLRQVAAA